MIQGASEMVYSAGACSVCASAGAAVFVTRLATADVFFACPSCGCAWTRPPTPFRVDTIDSPTTFAPDGFYIATSDEISAANLSELICQHEINLSEKSFEGVAGFRSRDEAVLDAQVVGEVLALPRRLRSSGQSIAALVARSGYPQRRESLTTAALVMGLGRHRPLVDDWLSYSEDKRTATGWFFSRTAEGGWRVGYYPSGPRHEFTDALEACALFVVKELATIAPTAG